MNKLVTRRKAAKYAASVIPGIFTKDELCKLHDDINSFRWDERLGEKPAGYDGKYGWRYAFAIMQEIEMIVGRRAVFRWFHTSGLGKTEAEADEWYWRQIEQTATWRQIEREAFML